MNKETLEGIGVLSLIGLLVFSPILTFGFAYIGGVILKWCVGNPLVQGLNLLFNTTRFQPQYIPVLCATLATIGKYFKSTQINKSDK